MSWKILYVDDEDDIREVAAMALELEPGFEVRTCSSGAEAFSLVSGWRPDLILLDVMMPEMDGPTTFQKLRETLGKATPPVLFCTARSQSHDMKTYAELGAKGVVSKPFDPMTLADTVRSYLQ